MPTADRAVMCWVCPHARERLEGGNGMIAWARRVWRRSGRWCAGGLDRDPVVDRLATGLCPRGRFNPHDRTTRWVFLAWIGVAKPLRWLAWALGIRRVASDGWWGCGCIKPMREAWDGLAARVAGVWKRPVDGPGNPLNLDV